MVVVDTSIWIDFFRGRNSDHSEALNMLIHTGKAALTGVVLAELLRGRRTPKERNSLEERLTGATLIEMTRAVWKRAGVISGDLDARGEPIAMTDVFIAAAALEGDHEIFTRDKHFERIPGLRLYQPQGDA